MLFRDTQDDSRVLKVINHGKNYNECEVYFEERGAHLYHGKIKLSSNLFNNSRYGFVEI